MADFLIMDETRPRSLIVKWAHRSLIRPTKASSWRMVVAWGVCQTFTPSSHVYLLPGRPPARYSVAFLGILIVGGNA